MEEEKLYGVGFCKAGATYQLFKNRMVEAEDNENKNGILLRREIKKNETLKRKIETLKLEVKTLKKEVKTLNKSKIPIKKD